MNTETETNTEEARSSEAPCSALIVPIEDDARNVRWWQYVNHHGTQMTKVVCRSTGWCVSSNEYGVGGLATCDLDKLVAFLRSKAPNSVIGGEETAISRKP